MKHKIDIWYTHAYGYYEIRFRKQFALPFVPFIGLTLVDYAGGDDFSTELVNNDYVSTRIHYHLNNDEFEINIRYPWKHPVTDEAIDSTIEQFTKFGWQRQDTTNIKELKELMLL